VKQLTQTADVGFEKDGRPTGKGEVLACVRAPVPRAELVTTAIGMKLSGSTIADVTLIVTATDNREKTFGLEMLQAKTGSECHFDRKLLGGEDSKSDPIVSANVITANVHDSPEVPDLLRRCGSRSLGNRTYRRKARRQRTKVIALRAKNVTGRWSYQNAPLFKADRVTGNQSPRVAHPGEGRSPHSDPQAPAGLHQSARSRSNEELRSHFRHARAGPSLQIGTTANGRREVGVSSERWENSPHHLSIDPNATENTATRRNQGPWPHFAATCSVLS
jgi:hypothetical protein